jgi:hypothetical protein
VLVSDYDVRDVVFDGELDLGVFLGVDDSDVGDAGGVFDGELGTCWRWGHWNYWVLKI